MSFRIEPTENFQKEVKRLQKKYPSLKQDLIRLNNELSINPVLGTPIGLSCYKIRLAITSKRKGKRGGARIITYVLVSAEHVYLLDIYDKSEQDTISEAELLKFLGALQKRDE